MKSIVIKFIGIALLLSIANATLGQNQNYLDFDGNNDYVRYTNDNTLKMINNQSNYTLEAWVYVPSGTSSGVNFFRRTNQFIVYYGSSNRLSFAVYNSSYKYYHTNNNTLSNDTWHHIAIVRDVNSTPYLKMYIDGVNQYSGTYNAYYLANNNNNNLYIGNNGNNGSYLDGYIDEIRLKRTATTLANLNYSKYGNQYESDVNTAALFHFNEGAGNTVNEASLVDATVNGSTWRAWNYQSGQEIPFENNFSWTGIISTDWGVKTNWNPQLIPVSVNIVTIPDVTNQPSITSGNTGNCGNVIIEASASLSIAGTLNIAGNFTNSGAFSATGTVKFNGDDEQEIPGGTYNDLDIDNSSAVNCTFADNVIVGGTLNIAGDITIQSGKSLDCNGPITTTGDCIINNNGTIYIGSTFAQNGLYSASAGLMVFDGAVAQSIPGDDYYNVEINNANGVNFDGASSVANTLTLTNGIITSTSANKLTITSTGSVSGGSNTAYVSGPMAKIGSTDFIFPLGDNSKWARIGISGLSASETFTAEYHNAKHADNATFTIPLTKVSDNEYWDLSRAGSSVTADVTMYWEDSKWSGIGDFADLRIGHYNGSAWEEQTGTYTNSGSASLETSESGSLTVTGVSSFSPFAPATTNNVNNTLPVELISFNAESYNAVVKLNWTTASELNNKGFEIQRSTDTKNWTNIAFVDGAGTSNEINVYDLIDNNPSLNNYYRLMQIDYDGKTKYSEIKYVALRNNDNINVYPNPAHNLLTVDGIDINTVHIVKVYNALGAEQKIELLSKTINISDLSPGYYYVHFIMNNGNILSSRFMKN